MKFSKKKIIEWAWRYIPLELAGLALTLAGSYIGIALANHEFIAAYAATAGGIIGYGSVLVIREIIQDHKKHKKRFKTYNHIGLAKTFRNIALEFTGQGIFITFFFMPAAIYTGTILLGRFWGVIAGQFVSSLVFYAIAIRLYEWRKEKFKHE